MQAAIFHEVGEALDIAEVPDPQPGPGDLVLRVKACGICGSDLHISCMPGALPDGSIMGHEFSGEVVEVGKQAGGGFAVGDRITALPAIACGRCAPCLSGDVMHCAGMQSLGLGQLPGAYAEFVRVGSQEAVRLPEGVDYRDGALVEPLAVGLHAVKQAQLDPGQRVLIIGAGPVGLAVSLWARFFGARSVVVSELSEGRRALADRLGATAAVDGKDDVATAFADHAGGPPDVVFECVGVPGMLMKSVELAPSRGKVVVAGVCMEPDTIMPLAAMIKELQLNFVLAYRRQDFELTLELLDQKRIEGASMVTDVIGLADLPEAFEALRTPSTQCKVLVEP